MARSKSSKNWLREHFNDPYVKKAQAEGYRSRAVYKLIEIQKKERLIKPNMIVVDLGAAPGGWSQIAATWVKPKGKVIAFDILPMPDIDGVEIITGDFTQEDIYQQLLDSLQGQAVDVVLSDMAPNMSGVPEVDQPRGMYLVELAYEFSMTVLKPGGSFVSKVFQGAGFDEFLKQLRLAFKKVVILKPDASRNRSPEVYMIAIQKR